MKKLNEELPQFPQNDLQDFSLILTMEYFMTLMDKHIDLVDRRILKSEKIPHGEKMFSIFETYTEWVNKGKMHPSVELAERLLSKYNISSWSFDKGYWLKENKEFLQEEVPKVIMPKLGKRNKTEDEEENSRSFKRLKNKHSAIESNINELEHRGLNRCPDRGFHHYKKYISLGVSAYNLKKIGREIIKQQKQQQEEANKKRLPKAA